MNDDLFFMKEALKEAQKAFDLGEVPVGAIAVWDGEIVGRGHNLREKNKNALAHAEIIAINEACNKLGGWRLHKCTLYVTLEPCPMCAGAIINARIKRLVYGAQDHKNGSNGSVIDIFNAPFSYHPTVEKGVMGEECEKMLKDFFANLRKQKEKERKTGEDK